MERHAASIEQDQLLTGLARLGQYLRVSSREVGQESGLTPTQIQILNLLKRRGATGMKALAREMAIKAPTLTDSVLALERKGLVKRRPSSADRRVMLAELTDKGLARANAVSGWPAPLLDVVSTLSPEEAGMLQRSLVKLISHLQDTGQISVQRMCVSCKYFRPNAHKNHEKPHHCAFVDAPFGDRALRVDCDDFESANEKQAEAAKTILNSGESAG